MSEKNLKGSSLRPEIQIGVTNKTVLYLDGEAYHIKAITSSGLVRFTNRSDIGVSSFKSLLSSSDSITIDSGMPNIREVDKKTYNHHIKLFESENPEKAAFLTTPVDADKYYLTKGAIAGFAVDGQSLVGLFNYTADSGVGEKLIGLAVERGASKLFCFDTELTDMYNSWGFNEYERAEWDENMAPNKWNYKKFGKPDVVWMKL